MAGGRPSKYKSAFAVQAKKLCGLGATDMDLADFFGVHVASIYRWRNEHEEFCESLRVGKEGPDNMVERALYQRALGYSHPDVDIRVVEGEIVETELVKHYPPDTKAALAWLYNRRGEKWHPSPDAVGGDDMAEILKSLIEKLPN